MAALKGRVALVTGGSRGIGAPSVSLAEAGAAVAVNYLRRRRRRRRWPAIRGRAAGRLGLAPTSPRPRRWRAWSRPSRRTGADRRPGQQCRPGLMRTLDDSPRTTSTDHRGQPEIGVPVHPGRDTRHAHAQWGRIVNISSGAARGAGGVGPHYNASKAGMEGMTRGYAARLVKDGITVNAVAPSLIQTDMVRRGRLVGVAHPARPLRQAGGVRAGRDDADRQRVHDRADGGAERRHVLFL